MNYLQHHLEILPSSLHTYAIPLIKFSCTFPLTRGSLLLSDFPDVESGLPGGEESTSTGASCFTFTSDGVCRLMSKATELEAGSWKWVTDKENNLTLHIDQSILKKEEKKREVGIHHKLNSHNPSSETHIKCNKTPNSLKRNCCKNWKVNDTQTMCKARSSSL